MGTEKAPTQSLIANFLSLSIPVEEYLRHGEPLTVEELESMSLTITGLRTILEVWKANNIVRLQRQPARAKPVGPGFSPSPRS